jgi:hypothetical protein
MKEQYEKLSMLNIDMNDFYTITLYHYELRLQGRLTETLLNKMKALGFVFKLSDQGYVESSLDHVFVTLTPMA